MGVVGCGLPMRRQKVASAKQAAPHLGPQKKEDPFYITELPAEEGSLWNDSGELFFVDRRARRVGDTIIVDIIENTSSSMDVNTKTSRSTGLESDVPNMLGIMRGLEATNPTVRNGGNTKLLSAEVKNSFDGKAKSDRSGQITASIGAHVTEVLPNGNVVIFGKREMRVNNESQFISVAGIIRPEDIGADNRVKSTYLADARIAYSGRGMLAERQRPGWLTRIVNRIWPF